MAIRDLPDMYALSPWPATLRLRAYISGKFLMAMLQLLHKAFFTPKHYFMKNTAHFYPFIFLHKILQVYIKALLHIHMKNVL